MSKGIRASLLLLLALTAAIGSTAAQSPGNQAKADTMETDVTKIKQAMLGDWVSIAPEVRPSAAKGTDGSLKPFYLKRAFKYLPSDRFELEIVNSADPYGAVPLARIRIGGHMSVAGRASDRARRAEGRLRRRRSLRGDSPCAGVCRRSQQGRLRRIRALGGERTAKHLRKGLRSLSRLKEGTNFMEYDLVYVRGDLLFWGARNIDGRGFDTEANRPTNLQIPLVRK